MRVTSLQIAHGPCGLCPRGLRPRGRRRGVNATAESGTCPNPQTFYVDEIEDRVLSALRAEMKSPQAVAEYVRTYHDERQKLAAKHGRQRATTERKIGELRRAL